MLHDPDTGERTLSGTDKLVYMANQIARFFEPMEQAMGVEGVAAHINSFWEPRMRAKLLAVIDAGGTGLHPLVTFAGEKINRPRV